MQEYWVNVYSRGKERMYSHGLTLFELSTLHNEKLYGKVSYRIHVKLKPKPVMTVCGLEPDEVMSILNKDNGFKSLFGGPVKSYMLPGPYRHSDHAMHDHDKVELKGDFFIPKYDWRS